MQPAGAQAGFQGLAPLFPAGEPPANSRTTAERGEENPAYLEKEVIKTSFLQNSLRNVRKKILGSRWYQEDCCIPGWKGELPAAGAGGRAGRGGREQQGRLPPSPSLPSPAGTALQIPPAPKAGRGSFVVAADIHGESLWVYRHLGTASSHPPPSQGRCWAGRGCRLWS